MFPRFHPVFISATRSVGVISRISYLSFAGSGFAVTSSAVDSLFASTEASFAAFALASVVDAAASEDSSDACSVAVSAPLLAASLPAFPEAGCATGAPHPVKRARIRGRVNNFFLFITNSL